MARENNSILPFVSAHETNRAHRFQSKKLRNSVIGAERLARLSRYCTILDAWQRPDHGRTCQVARSRLICTWTSVHSYSW